MSDTTQEFSFRTREKSLDRFRSETFDLLVIGGGITGAAVARDATSRGLKVALVERRDFAFGTSSRSSKMIHGGLRYLQNFEFKLVFEALSERTLLLKTAPNLVRPLPFYLPSYKGDANGRLLLSCGMWLYDLLALFRAPGFHKSLSRKELLKKIPFLREEGLKGGFHFYDASMWDDALAVETLRSAQQQGAAVANYVEALEPVWKGEGIVGFKVRDLEGSNGHSEWNLFAHRTVVCVGPWTDQLGSKLTKQWQRWLTPSKGIHLIFDLKRIPIPGAIMMSHPQDGRVAFVIPRPDYGAGVVLVGTTDGPTHLDPEKAEIDSQEVQYLLDLLQRYFPTLNLGRKDILSAYVGVRPLMGGEVSAQSGAQPNSKSESDSKSEPSSVLQKVSREHHIALGPGGTVIVAGGKYTTHRKMAEEIVDFAIKEWKEGRPASIGPSNTRSPVNPCATTKAMDESREIASRNGIRLPQELLNRYGADGLKIVEIQKELQRESIKDLEDPPGFPHLEAQLRHCIRTEMVLHLEDFYLRRVPLYASRLDHGMPWASMLAKVWSQERERSEIDTQMELARLRVELDKRSSWLKGCESSKMMESIT